MTPNVLFCDQEPLEKSEQATRILICGDWSPPISGNSEFVLQEGSRFYGDVSRLIHDADISVVNMELALTSSSKTEDKSGPSATGPELLASHLKTCGFNVACLANNHICDAGKEGISNTINLLNHAGVESVGAAIDESQIYRALELQASLSAISIINASDGLESNEKHNPGYGAADIESWQVAARISEARSAGRFVIVITHAGAEFLPIPTPRIRRLYRDFIELGADIVLGHHPHVLQGVEWHKSCPIFYSLGNFGICRDFRRRSEEFGCAVMIDIVANKIEGLSVIPIENTDSGINWIESSGKNNFLDFWGPAVQALESSTKYAAIWQEYVKSYDLLAKSVDIFWELLSNPKRAVQLFRNLLVDNCYREHVRNEVMCAGSDDLEDAQLLLKRWGAFRSRKRGARLLSYLVGILGRK